MQLPFYKYQGTGNDFVMIDNRHAIFPKNNTRLVAQLCDRRFGIGADGLILLEDHAAVDFTMVYYNADGNLSSMCGNGGRCITHFAKFLGVINDNATFEAVDGMHTATVEGGIVKLKMNDVSSVSVEKDFVFLNTGSPHHVQLVDSLEQYDVFSEGKRIRNTIYGSEGANVNFVTQVGSDIFSVRTYERGVEDETLSCGTGVTAVAIAMHAILKTEATTIALQTPGGNLKVYFEKTQKGYENVYLEGAAKQVYKGEWS
ncbi:diaminopimelate epimerase [Jejudonia soesokkakensis]|uniref:Diaminopimelate epimerase n=1 Tax=Jejudonia soesokkakensis TaxID=1323432 RepID=A0ABW2MUG3_9FLAO